MALKFIFVLGKRTLKASPQWDPGYFAFLIASFVSFGPIHTLVRACIHAFLPELIDSSEATIWRDKSAAFLIAVAISIATTWIFLDARSSSIEAELDWVPTYESHFARLPIGAGVSALAVLLMFLSFQDLFTAVLGTASVIAACEVVIQLSANRVSRP